MIFSTTPRWIDLLRYLTGAIEARGYCPSYQECAVSLGASKTNVAEMVLALDRMGLIRRLPNRARAITVIHKPSIPRAPNGAPLYYVEVK